MIDDMDTSQAMTAVPMAELYKRQAEIFTGLKDAPNLLTGQNQDAAVLVHPNMWNRLIEDIKHYQRLVRIERARRDLDLGNGYTYEQVEAMLQQESIL